MTQQPRFSEISVVTLGRGCRENDAQPKKSKIGDAASKMLKSDSLAALVIS